MKKLNSITLLLAIVLLSSITKAKDLICEGYQISNNRKSNIDVSGSLQIDDLTNKTISAFAYLKELGKEGQTYFEQFHDVIQDNSKFSKYFESESVGFNHLISGLYAGVSPEIETNYPLYQEIKNGIPFNEIPKRSFIIFSSDKKVFAELFCYTNKPSLKQ